MTTATQQTTEMVDVTFEQAMARLNALDDWENRARSSMRQSLGPIRDLLNRLGNPHAGRRYVHVTGTKGKGSVCSLIEHALAGAGLKVGRYGSPHLACPTERVSLSGAPIEQAILGAALSSVLDQVEKARQDFSPAAGSTWFDVFTAAALLIFCDEGCDWVILEVGLGGRLDSTNIVDAELAVITNVELEHTEVLGSTRQEIAREKAGIINRGATVITAMLGDDPVAAIIRLCANRHDAKVIQIDPALRSIKASNCAMAGAVLDELGARGVRGRGICEDRPVGSWLLQEDLIERAALPGRMERYPVDESGNTVEVVLDGAHVPFNLAAVLRDLTEGGLAGRCIVVFAAGADKDASGLLQALAPVAARIYATPLGRPGRFIDPAAIRELGSQLGLHVEVITTAADAVRSAISEAALQNMWVLVTESLHLVSAVRSMSEQGFAIASRRAA